MNTVESIRNPKWILYDQYATLSEQLPVPVLPSQQFINSSIDYNYFEVPKSLATTAQCKVFTLDELQSIA